MTRRVLREQEAVVKDAGFTVLGQRTSGHKVLRCRAPAGHVVSFSLAGSPGDVRALKNFRALVRRALIPHDRSTTHG